MFARDDQHSPPDNNGHGPPWLTPVQASVSSDSASPATATSSASNADEATGGILSSTELASVTSQFTSASNPTTFATQLSFGDSVISLSVPSTSPTSSTSVTNDQSLSSAALAAESTQYWPYAVYGSSYGSPQASLTQTDQAWGPLSDGSVPTQSGIVSSSDSSATQTALQPGYQSSDHSNRHSFNGTILAAIVIPVMFLLLIGIVVVVCLRRRRHAKGVLFGPVTEIREKMFFKRASSDVPIPETRQVSPPQPHLITSPQNNTYFTGLDTMSLMSAEPRERSSEDPPPPYWSSSERAGRSVSMSSAATSIARPLPALLDVRSPPLNSEPLLVPERSPFDDPPGNVSRTSSSRSITSTLYSSNASLIEARPAKRSMSGAQLVGQDEVSPFADPDSNHDS